MAGRGTERRKALSSCRLAFVRGRTKFGLNLCCILHATEDRLPILLFIEFIELLPFHVGYKYDEEE